MRVADERRELSEMCDTAKHRANMMQSANSLHETHEASFKDKVAPSNLVLQSHVKQSGSFSRHVAICRLIWLFMLVQQAQY